MLNFIKKYLSKSELKSSDSSSIQFSRSDEAKRYAELLSQFLSDGKLSEKEKEELEKFSKENNISEEELSQAHKKAASLSYKDFISDERITEEERELFQELANYFDLNPEDFDFNQKEFNRFYILALLDKGVLPNISSHDLDIVLKKGEILHWACPAQLRKYKNIVNRVRYAGPTVSIKIMKGVYYRMGSIKFDTRSTEHLIIEDLGSLFMTNLRIGFKGERKNFTVPYSQILSYELTQSGLEIIKENRETPYIIGLEEYDIPCMIISNIIENI